MHPRSLFPYFSRLVAGLAGLLAANLVFAAPVKFNIPAQAAADALVLFSKQAGIDVLFASPELKKAQSAAVVGEFEPDAAIARLLKGTGFTAARDGDKFVVAKAAGSATGSIRGSLALPNGAPAAGVLVVVRETAQSAETDQDGQFFFHAVAPGSHVLVARAEGYQPLHITDVMVKSGSELLLSKETLHKPGEGVTVLEPFVVHAESVTELDKYSVYGVKQKPFEGANMDIPRTINDAQPYYIFDSKTIDRSGATNIEDFLKQRLTMNASAQTNAQTGGNGPQNLGNTSSINLRGLGTDKTLILVDGRRRAGVTVNTTDYQPDLNGIPLSAIDRIEVLPSSASGIYGGSAIGGVINVILKQDYTGGEFRGTYDNTWDTDSPTRTVSASYGFGLEGGKTHVTLNATWAENRPLLLRDRQGIFEHNIATILKNNPGTIYSATNPFLGALPNITAQAAAQATLSLKNGVVLASRNTYVAAGTPANIAPADLYASLVANAGRWDLDLPISSQSPTGLLRALAPLNKTRSFQAAVRRKMSRKLELFADFAYDANSAITAFNPATNNMTVALASPVNPFTTAVVIKVPDASQAVLTTDSVNRSFTVGTIAQLPWGWTGELDYARSENEVQTLGNGTPFDSAAANADILSGALNPFVDTLLFPLSLAKYRGHTSVASSSTLNDFTLRGSGPLWSLPWGTPSLVLGLEHRIAETPDNVNSTALPISISSGMSITAFGRRQVTDSAYGELTFPLGKKTLAAVSHVLELQLSGRSERYTVNSGTDGTIQFGTAAPILVGPTLNGQRYFAKTTYTASNGTVGLKYQPVRGLTLRTSLATAFLPPTPAQLTSNPLRSATTISINDPKTGQNGVPVYTVSGGNPGLKPQSSTSWNAGLIWEPTWRLLRGLRLNAEYYSISQDDAIGSLNAQTIVNFENNYPERVARDAAGTITQVDISMVNLYKRRTEGWDLSADYSLKTGAGTFTLNAVESIILHLKSQYAPTLPAYDGVDFPSESGAVKYKSNATLTWTWGNWTAGWSALYYSAYRQSGSAGGPGATQRAATGTTDSARAPSTTYTAPQGGDTIPSQLYHDVLLGYAFGRLPVSGGSRFSTLRAKILSGLSVQVGVKNVFNKLPPFDAFYSGNYYFSPYGDLRLRSYVLSVKKAF